MTKTYFTPARFGNNTNINETITSASALNSCQCGCSPRNNILLNTPSTGIISIESDVTLADPWLMSLFHAQ